MTQLIFNKQIANEIFNDNLFREELIIALNELIDIELAKPDDEIDFELIDAYTDALNDLYDEKGVARVFWKLQTVEEFTNSITSNKKWKRISFGMKITLTACAVFALLISANSINEKLTGYNVLEQVANAVQQLFTGETIAVTTTTAESTSESATEETTTAAVIVLEEDVVSEATTTETTTKKQEVITPQNPNLSEVLRPTTPPTETTTETTTEEPFTRVDEDVTSSPIVIKLRGDFADNFKRNYIVGESADFSGLVITAKYDNGDTKALSINECNVYGFSTESPANRIVTIEYEGCSFSYLIRVKEAN